GAGWTILHRNWRWRRKEVDIVARLGDIVAFIEVRSRADTAHGHPLETIRHRKQRDLEAAGHAWIRRHGSPTDNYRFDAISLIAPQGDVARAVVEHTPDAWRR